MTKNLLWLVNFSSVKLMIHSIYRNDKEKNFYENSRAYKNFLEKYSDSLFQPQEIDFQRKIQDFQKTFLNYELDGKTLLVCKSFSRC
jgi:hypothetical protein